MGEISVDLYRREYILFNINALLIPTWKAYKWYIAHYLTQMGEISVHLYRREYTLFNINENKIPDRETLVELLSLEPQ